MAAGRSPWPHPDAAAARETRISACARTDITWHARPNGHPCSVRLHGDVFVSREHSRAIMRANSVDVTDHGPLVVRELDHRVEIADPAAAFRSREACCDLIHAALAEAAATREYDLAAGNWEEFLPDADALAARIVAGDVHDTPGFVLDIKLFLWIKLVDYSEPKALLLACKEAAGVSASGQKRLREPGEPCAICLSGRGAEDEETVRLPCSHEFHGRCIERWFHRKSTCPTCRRDVVECLGFARSASPVDPVVGDEQSTP